MGEVFLLSRSLAQDYSDYSGICAGYQLLCVSLAQDNNPPSDARGPHLLCWLADARQNILQYIALHYFAVRGGLAFGTGSHSCPAQGFFIIRKWTTAAADPASDCFSWFLFFLLYDHDCTSPRNFSCVILRNNLIIPWFPDIRVFSLGNFKHLKSMDLAFREEEARTDLFLTGSCHRRDCRIFHTGKTLTLTLMDGHNQLLRGNCRI